MDIKLPARTGVRPLPTARCRAPAPTSLSGLLALYQSPHRPSGQPTQQIQSASPAPCGDIVAWIFLILTGPGSPLSRLQTPIFGLYSVVRPGVPTHASSVGITCKTNGLVGEVRECRLSQTQQHPQQIPLTLSGHVRPRTYGENKKNNRAHDPGSPRLPGQLIFDRAFLAPLSLVPPGLDKPERGMEI